MLLGSVSSSQALQRWTRQLSGPDPAARTGPRLGGRAAAAFLLALLFLLLWRAGLLPAKSVQALIVLCAIEVLSPPGYLSLLSVARTLLDVGGYAGGSLSAGRLRWFETSEDMENAGVSRRDRRSALDLALSVAQTVNEIAP